VVIAVLEQLARPVTRFIFSAEILRPPHPFVAPRVARCRQAMFIRNSISHAFPYFVREDAGSPQHIPKFKRPGRCPRISTIGLINSPLVFREAAVSDRANKGKNCGDTETFKKQ
jgi:hypothetical protein